MAEPSSKPTPASSRDLLLLLKDIESRSLRHVAELPQQRDLVGIWEGILFTVLGTRVITPLQEVKEILNFPPILTRVPGTKSWMLGVANIRGNLLPVIDLQLYLGGDRILTGKRSRILVINQQGIRAGLLVGDVYGIRHLKEEQSCDIPAMENALADHVARAFRVEDEAWPVFSIARLAENPDFHMASA